MTAMLGASLLAAAATVGGAAASAQTPGGLPPADPNSQGHAYRHGAVPFRGAGHAPPACCSTSTSNDLRFDGGVDNVGVTTGPPKVYLVFWGSQWGTQSLDGNGYYDYSGDPSGMAPDIEAFFAGLGSQGETWSGVMTQYCEGVAAGAVTCPSSASHVGYPASDPGQPGALGGVWEDNSAAAPGAATAHQLAQEALHAATVFGNTTSGANRDAEYFIVSPTGTTPDGFNTPTGQFCAWHDYTGDSTMDGGGAVSSSFGPVAFTNMPYVADAGLSCGAYFVSGALDGVTIVGGHEYAETITDQFPAGGWVDASGYETGDKCAWISSGQGAATDIPLSTGSFAVQSTWANDFNGGSGGCEISHPIVTNANTVTVTNPGNQSSTLGAAITPLTVQATDSNASQTLTYSATGLPTGLSLNSSTGQISGTPTQDVYDASVTVTATDGTGSHGSTTFLWTVTPSGGNTVTVTNPGNQSSTAGTATTLQITASDDQQNQTLTYSSSGLPAGLSLNSSTGLVSGTPTTAGTSNVTVTATDRLGYKGSASFTWTVNPAPDTVTVTNPGNQSTRVNTHVSLQIQATSSANKPLTYSAKGLPTGLTINSSTGLISGTTPSSTGTWSVTITATDGTATGSTSFTWTIRKH
jgi:serine protease